MTTNDLHDQISEHRAAIKAAVTKRRRQVDQMDAIHDELVKTDPKVELLSGPVRGVVTPRTSGLTQTTFYPDIPNVCACGKLIPAGRKRNCSGTCYGTSFTDPVEEDEEF